jgi:hypothetical protein
VLAQPLGRHALLLDILEERAMQALEGEGAEKKTGG